MFRPEYWLQKRSCCSRPSRPRTPGRKSVHFDLRFPKYIATFSSQFWLLYHFVPFYSSSHPSKKEMICIYKQTVLFQGGSWTDLNDEAEGADGTRRRHAGVLGRLNRICTTQRAHPDAVPQNWAFKRAEGRKGERGEFVWIVNMKYAMFRYWIL